MIHPTMARLYSARRLSQSEPMTTPFTIEELISELTRLAAARGWGAQSLTNIVEIDAQSGERKISLLTGKEENIEDLEHELQAALRNARNAEEEVDLLQEERDALRRAVEKLSGEVLSLKEAARQ